MLVTGSRKCSVPMCSFHGRRQTSASPQLSRPPLAVHPGGSVTPEGHCWRQQRDQMLFPHLVSRMHGGWCVGSVWAVPVSPGTVWGHIRLVSTLVSEARFPVLQGGTLHFPLWTATTIPYRAGHTVSLSQSNFAGPVGFSRQLPTEPVQWDM